MSNLSARISALAESHRECTALIARLAKVSGVGADSTRSELATQIHNTLKACEAELELVTTQAESELDPEVRGGLLGRCSKLEGDLRVARTHFRRAQLQAKRNADAERRKEREALFGNPESRAALRARKKDSSMADDVVLTAASDVTASLRRTHELLASELQQSRFAAETLANSTAAMRELSQRYSRVDELMMSSRRLITDLVRKSRSDRWYWEKSIWILAGTLAWLVFRRWLMGPLWLFVWLPFRLFWWILATGLGTVIGGGKEGNFLDTFPSEIKQEVRSAVGLQVESPKVWDVEKGGETVGKEGEFGPEQEKVHRIIDEGRRREDSWLDIQKKITLQRQETKTETKTEAEPEPTQEQVEPEEPKRRQDSWRDVHHKIIQQEPKAEPESEPEPAHEQVEPEEPKRRQDSWKDVHGKIIQQEPKAESESESERKPAQEPEAEGDAENQPNPLKRVYEVPEEEMENYVPPESEEEPVVVEEAVPERNPKGRMYEEEVHIEDVPGHAETESHAGQQAEMPAKEREVHDEL